MLQITVNKTAEGPVFADATWLIVVFLIAVQQNTQRKMLQKHHAMQIN